jgi:hypothetical protein
MSEYERIGAGYARLRRADPRLARAIADALDDDSSVLNVGAGAGSYEPPSIATVAVEPAATMIAQRPRGGAPCVRAHAEALPFADQTFDAGLDTAWSRQTSDRGEALLNSPDRGNGIARRGLVVIGHVEGPTPPLNRGAKP